MNDDLVAKKFGVYHSQLAAGRELDELEQEPVMLPASVLKQTAGARTPPPGKHAHRLGQARLDQDPADPSNLVPFTASSPAPLTPPSTPQVSTST